jgi:hypothetical protein
MGKIKTTTIKIPGILDEDKHQDEVDLVVSFDLKKEEVVKDPDTGMSEEEWVVFESSVRIQFATDMYSEAECDIIYDYIDENQFKIAKELFRTK